MDIQDLVKDARNLTDYELDRRLTSLIINNGNYKNLDKKNRQLVLSLLKKFRTYLKRGYTINSELIRREMYPLRRDRIKLGLDDPDLDDIENILNAFGV
ncbi:hypothetical protein A2303_00820 [Candidatus Falkowbacteria bacterium RIFOXYB2_FULL_47_14]|uniref:Uncharacterized protein n=1 Tax=Candidatus Falkowbacteria bacterium RIFOXYA2_FULL_47_19 TaxID=1797994 RepID=A0A1F5SG07_9BACT|nr:MAG: hypothetical protein A2227_00020 [Candidatus Falkowbacteria bacterium RIFOXYA2_FULL_47_19]OGF35604.1 MAG: hypothetical protein A2468_06255 [Candidatus Falkowbacteria bacterium RIFOXYC2_FULL_46_15]OGF42912.1 MAG: hypothetical protein A2303_00820 [Candidatus Falkowbacteria bacterium RIFOXYB2_FULL_47_14]